MVLSNHRDSTTLQTFSDWKMSLNDDSVFYLNVDDSLVYEGFHSDFGPLNLAMIYRYIDIIRDKFKVSSSAMTRLTYSNVIDQSR